MGCPPNVHKLHSTECTIISITYLTIIGLLFNNNAAPGDDYVNEYICILFCYKLIMLQKGGYWSNSRQCSQFECNLQGAGTNV